MLHCSLYSIALTNGSLEIWIDVEGLYYSLLYLIEPTLIRSTWFHIPVVCGVQNYTTRVSVGSH